MNVKIHPLFARWLLVAFAWLAAPCWSASATDANKPAAKSTGKAGVAAASSTKTAKAKAKKPADKAAKAKAKSQAKSKTKSKVAAKSTAKNTAKKAGKATGKGAGKKPQVANKSKTSNTKTAQTKKATGAKPTAQGKSAASSPAPAIAKATDKAPVKTPVPTAGSAVPSETPAPAADVLAADGPEATESPESLPLESQPAEQSLVVSEESDIGPWVEMGGVFLLISGGVVFLYLRSKKSSATQTIGFQGTKLGSSLGSALNSLNLGKSTQTGEPTSKHDSKFSKHN